MSTLQRDLAFFTPAASSFNPTPYAPQPPSLPKLHPRTLSLPSPLPLMDPSPSDPQALFLHPPFNTFPGVAHSPDGLSYALMAANPEWFLDPNDFLTTSHPADSDAVPYPSQLEPPRGWCPAKKKDLKQRGPDGWPEGEEPRLRCTFCRRTYAGVNAKSMWRRHVFEKHKIAMANRRDGNDRSRARGSNKENKLSHDSRSTPDLSQDLDSVATTHRSRFRTLLPADSVSSKNSTRSSTPSAPLLTQCEFSPPTPPPTVDKDVPRPHPLSQSTLPASPPLTPRSASPVLSPVFTVPQSPYDPSLTPSFRHSTPRLPSDQPWRFPSPSHPLHSRARELCLGVLVRASPAKGLGSPATSPVVAGVRDSPRVRGSPIGATAGSPLVPGARDSPRTLFARGRLPVPVPLSERMRGRVPESPLSRQARTRAQGHARADSDGWLAPSSSVVSSPARGLVGADDDPFGGIGMYSLPWIDAGGPTKAAAGPSPPVSGDEGESPVLRSSQLPREEGVGLGIGLMEPFSLAVGQDEVLMYPLQDVDMDEEDALEVAERYLEGEGEWRRPAKRRKVDDD